MSWQLARAHEDGSVVIMRDEEVEIVSEALDAWEQRNEEHSYKPKPQELRALATLRGAVELTRRLS